MPSIASLLDIIQEDFPELSFSEGAEFRWSSNERTIYYKPNEESSLLLHELGHALLDHKEYRRDIELLSLERAAWEAATQRLSLHYNIPIDEEEVEGALDTYRDWLHLRSTCPECHASGIQTAANLYKCIACHTSWRVNEARTCALRRYVVK